MEPTIVVLGLPGAGKRTQAEKLSNVLEFPKLDMGEILRANKSYVTESGRTVGEIIDEGDPVSAKTAAKLLSEYLDEIANQEADGLVLDGYPRTGDQATAAKEVIDIDLILIIDVSDEEIYDRLTKRRVCPNCGEQYHLESNPPMNEGYCDKCGTELIQRADDTREGIKERIIWQRKGLNDIERMYNDTAKIIRINGDDTIQGVWEEIKCSLESELDLNEIESMF